MAASAELAVLAAMVGAVVFVDAAVLTTLEETTTKMVGSISAFYTPPSPHNMRGKRYRNSREPQSNNFSFPSAMRMDEKKTAVRHLLCVCSHNGNFLFSANFLL